jgi:hypothetical protein
MMIYGDGMHCMLTRNSGLYGLIVALLMNSRAGDAGAC